MLRKKLIAVFMVCIMALSFISSIMAVRETDAADMWRSSLYPENWTPGYTNNQGQFLHDFSYAGYEKGEKELLSKMDGFYADVTQYGADNTGANDSTSAIQSAINAVQAAGGGTVYLPEGTYKVKPSSSSNASALRITGSNILFKGAGIGKTFIRCYAENMRYCQIINVSPSSATWDQADDGNYYSLSQDIPFTPTTTIHLSNVGNLKAGDWVIIRSDRTQDWIDEHEMGGFWYASVNPTTMGTTFYRQIQSVDQTNKTIEIDIPTRYYMKTRDNARVYKVSPKQANVGLSDFSIGNKSNPGSGWGEEDYSTSGTGAYNVNNAFLIKFSLNVNCFAKNIASYQAGNASQIHMSSNGLDLNKTRNATIENCDFSHPQYEGGGGNGYGMNICGQETLIKNCSSTSARHSFAFKYSYANGNVIYHYTSTDPKHGSDFHMYLSMSNLIDNEELNGDFVESNVRPYGGTAGNRHGYTSTQTVFWNTKGNRYKSGNNYIIDSRQYGYGYIIGTQGAATAVKTTPTIMSSQYGTINTSPEDYTEGIGAGESLYPQSLYYDQLERRLRGNSGETPSVTVTDIPGKVSVNSYAGKSGEITFTTAGGIMYAGNLNNNSYLDYYINVPVAGEYIVKLNLAAGDAQYNAKNIIIKINDTAVATVPIQGSSDWETFIEHTAKLTFDKADRYKITLVSDGGGGACNIADFTLQKEGEVTTQPQETTAAPVETTKNIEIEAGDIDLSVGNNTSVYDRKGLADTYTWSNDYLYQGHANYSGITDNHKYLVMTYTGDISLLRLGNADATHIVWFTENGQGNFVTVNGTTLPKVGNNTTVVIDLAASGVSPIYFSDFHIHAGEADGTAGTVTITKAWLTTSIPKLPEESTTEAPTTKPIEPTTEIPATEEPTTEATYTVSIDGTTVTTAKAGDKYTLPRTARVGYYADGKMYKKGSSYMVTGDINFLSVDLKANTGASIRLADPSGLTFKAAITCSDSTLFSEDVIVNEGMLITTNDIYSEEGSLDLTSDYTKLNIANSGWSGTAGSFSGSIVGIQSMNYGRTYIARAYVTVKFADGTQSVLYSGMTGVRSVRNVATSMKNTPSVYNAMTTAQKVLIDRFIAE